ETRLGRAFSLHTFGGLAGFAVAPPLMLVLASLFDWRAALVIVGAVGIATGIVLVLFRALLRDDAERRKTAGMQALRQLLTRPLILMFLFTTFSSATSAGIYNFSIAAFVDIYGVELALASSSLTIFVVMTAAGVLPGGMLADKAGRHDLVLVVCTVIVIACILLAGWGALPFWLALGALGLAGLARGIVNASRDLMVRHIAGGASVGTAFAFVTTGFLLGQAIAPPIYGYLIDQGSPQFVFWASAAFSLISIGTVFASRTRYFRDKGVSG
ncbi:MAG: MFS transporter, partial [Proteobacteria bacterium]|nr:MFS transporter [Pseudomonadota bacterium]